MVTVIKNSVVYPWKLLREYILKVLTTNKEKVIMWSDGN